MSRATFDFICRLVGPAIARLNTRMRDAVPVEKRVAGTVEGLIDFQAKLNKMDMERMVLTNLAPDFFGIKNHCTTAHLVQNRLV